MPIMTANERTVHQIAELMVGLILKELDVLTISQMRYFEAIVDLFNDEITIGVIFWLKICYEFNWRLIYAKQVVGHRNKHLKQTIQLIYTEIESNANQKCLTSEEISYFYSVVECICVQLLAINIAEESTEENEFLAEMRTKCLLKMSELKFDPLFTQLSTFNVLSQELTYFVLNVNQTDCLCVETIDKKVFNCLYFKTF